MAGLPTSSMGIMFARVSPVQPKRYGEDTGKMPVRLMGGAPMPLFDLDLAVGKRHIQDFVAHQIAERFSGDLLRIKSR